MHLWVLVVGLWRKRKSISGVLFLAEMRFRFQAETETEIPIGFLFTFLTSGFRFPAEMLFRFPIYGFRFLVSWFHFLAESGFGPRTVT